jgi:mono/diheme cytochrome c family protein
MRKVLHALGILLGAVTALVALLLLALFVISEERLNQTYEIQVEEVAVPEDPASIEHGRRLVRSVGFCSDCHGENFAGQVFDEGPLVGRITVKNLTPGTGGMDSSYKTIDWVRAIRHGVGRDGRSLLDMPSTMFYHFSDRDLGAIIAYLQSLPPVDNELPDKQIGLMGRLIILQEPSLLPAQQIDHDAPRPPVPEPAVTAEYGRYLSMSCQLCHGEDLAGSDEPGAGLNLTPAGDLYDWTEADFIRTMRTGVTPEGDNLNPDLMPWKRIGEMNDEELRAIWLYLQTLSPVENTVPLNTPQDQE